jgi:hypothetical protein
MNYFWEKVDKSGGPDACWPWMACRDKAGYGRFLLDGSPRSAHRVAAQLSGLIARVYPAKKDEWVLHYCDNPACCNPAHLFVGDHKRNMQDSAMKGRRPRSNMILSDQDVADIVAARAAGVSVDALVEKYKVPRHLIWSAKYQNRRIKPALVLDEKLPLERTKQIEEMVCWGWLHAGDIAEQTGCSNDWVRAVAKRLGVRLPRKPPSYVEDKSVSRKNMKARAREELIASGIKEPRAAYGLVKHRLTMDEVLAVLAENT